MNIKIPKARKLPSGKWHIALRFKDGVEYITESTKRECEQKALRIKASRLSETTEYEKSKGKNLTVRQAIDRYITSRDKTLSASTIRGYEGIKRSRFQSVMDERICDIDNWQAVINNETQLASAKTIHSAYSLVKSAIYECCGISIKATLPQVEINERPYLEPDEVLMLIKGVKDMDIEMPVLLALHGLRKSELYALKKEDVKKDIMHIHSATIDGIVDGKNVRITKNTGKSKAANRYVPILIDRLSELIKMHPGGVLCTDNPSTTYKAIRRTCEAMGISGIGFHSLRHSFASVAYKRLTELELQKLGGWEDARTMHKIYIHLAEKDRIAAADKLKSFFAEE